MPLDTSIYQMPPNLGNLGQSFMAGQQAAGQMRDQQQTQQVRAMQIDEHRLSSTQAQQEAVDEQRFRELFSGDTLPTPQAIYSQLGPARGSKIIGALSALEELASKKVTNARDTASRLAIGLKDSPPVLQQEWWPAIRKAAVEGGLGDEQQIPEQLTPEYLDLVSRWASGKEQKEPGTREVKVRNADGSETIQIVADTAGQTFESAAEPKKPPTLGSEEDYALRYAAARNMKPEQLTEGDFIAIRKARGQADDRAITVKTGGDARGLTPNMESQVINRLANQWTVASKPARDLERQVGIMDTGIAAARRGDLAQGAQAVLVTFQKILDPTSVVRESEFDRSAAGQSLMNRAKGAMERLAKGGAGVPLPELEKFAGLARDIAVAQRGSRLEAVKERVGKVADRYKLPRELIFEAEAASNPEAAAPAPTTAAPASVAPSYQDYLKRKGGR